MLTLPRQRAFRERRERQRRDLEDQVRDYDNTVASLRNEVSDTRAEMVDVTGDNARLRQRVLQLERQIVGLALGLCLTSAL